MKASWRLPFVVILGYGSVAGCGDVASDAIVRAQGSDAACDSDVECSGAASHCELTTGICRRCLEPAHCPAGQTCALPSGTCVLACGEGVPCGGSEPVCDVTTGLCRACEGDVDCTTAGAGRCQASGACVECLDPSDCVAGSERPFCDAAGRCVECQSDGHCDDEDEVCSTALGLCATRCSATVPCTDDDPICDFALGFCVECQDDRDCEPGVLCRSSECEDDDDD
jgi:hypothetical protein